MSRWWLSVAVGLLGLLFCPQTVSAQGTKTTPTPTGYERSWVGIGRGGADSVYHRVHVTRRNPGTDTLTVIFRNGERRVLAINYNASTVFVELIWFKRYLAIDEYPEVHERLFDRGWQSWYSGIPRQLLRVRYNTVARVFLKAEGGLDLPITPKPPD